MRRRNMRPANRTAVLLVLIVVLTLFGRSWEVEVAVSGRSLHVAADASNSLDSSILRATPRKLLQKRYALSADPDNKDCYLYRAGQGDTINDIAKDLGVSAADLRERNSKNIADFSRLNGRFVQICNIGNLANAEIAGQTNRVTAAPEPVKPPPPPPAPKAPSSPPPAPVPPPPAPVPPPPAPSPPPPAPVPPPPAPTPTPTPAPAATPAPTPAPAATPAPTPAPATTATTPITSSTQQPARPGISIPLLGSPVGIGLPMAVVG